MKLAIKLAVAATLAGCGKSDEPPKPAKIEGSCKVSVSGPATVDETTPAGKTVSISQWADAETKKRFGTSQNMFLHCEGKQVSVSFTGRGAEDELPLAPRKYELVNSGRLIWSFNGQLKAPNLPDLTLVSDKGTLEITAFDARRIAGTFEVEAKHLRETAGPGDAKIKGTFDFTCPGICN